ncbi:MAG: hypothetical protein JWQ33_821 [Ramlibacter sp.]|nr:hypothetical protein [Ramlibacter sp.]
MSEQQNFGFGKFVPGFDFLQNLTKGASQSQTALPNLSNWVAPTLSVEELDKRIGELKAVHFWLDQNSKALGATIQALELQKMTLATLKGMNFNMADIANALKLKPAGAAAGADKETPGTADHATGSVAGAAKEAVAKARAGKRNGQQAAAAAGVVDPMQWWGALTQQFQEIAAGAMKEAAKDPAAELVRAMAGGASPSGDTGTSPRPSAPRKAAARKTSGSASKPARKNSARSR